MKQLSPSLHPIGTSPGVCGADYFAVEAAVVHLVVVILAIIAGFCPFTLGYPVASAVIQRRQESLDPTLSPS